MLELLLGGRRGQAVGDSSMVAMVAPHHLDVEVLNALRGLLRSGRVSEARGTEASHDLATARLERIETRELIPRIWDWRENLSSYDAAYVVLAEILRCPLLTADAKLGRAVGDSLAVLVV